MKQRLAILFDRCRQFVSTKTARRIVLGVFVAQALILAFITHIGVPPDENNHLNFIRYYADHSISPVFHDQTPTWSLGDKTREVDYLYHYGASFVARILPGEDVEVYVIRILSVLAALVTMIALTRLLRQLGVSSSAITVALAIITNLPMVLMVSAAVNNDVFVWLGYVVGLLLIYRIWRRPTFLDVTWLLALVAAGGLVKRTLLPVGVVFAVAAAVLAIRKWQPFIKSFKLDWRLIVAGFSLLLATGLFVERIGGNLYQYGTIAPTCEEVQGEKACDAFWANSRAKWLKAGAPAESNTWLAKGTVRDESPMPLPIFAGKWLNDSMANIIDIQTQSWRHKVVPPVWLAPTLLLLMIGAVSYGVGRDIYQWRKKKQHVALLRLFAVASASIVMAAHLNVNYSLYLSYHVYGLALNGRYILPALLILIGLSCYYTGQLLPRRVSQAIVIMVVLLVVVFSGLTMMLRNSQLVTG